MCTAGWLQAPAVQHCRMPMLQIKQLIIFHQKHSVINKNMLSTAMCSTKASSTQSFRTPHVLNAFVLTASLWTHGVIQFVGRMKKTKNSWRLLCKKNVLSPVISNVLETGFNSRPWKRSGKTSLYNQVMHFFLSFDQIFVVFDAYEHICQRSS